MGIRITNRDKKIMDFLKEFRCANTSQLMGLFNIERSTLNRRMNQLIDEFQDLKKIDYNPTHNFYDDKYKGLLSNQNLYYWNRKPSAPLHDLIRNEIYIRLINSNDYKLILCDVEYPIATDNITVRADLRIVLEYENREFEFLIEIENNKSFNSDKYYKLELENILVPPILIPTDRRVINKCKYLETHKMKINLSNFDTRMKQILNEQYYGYKVNK